jgi:FKBP-type peptidyl-prolyl cis-trans isomerase
MPRYQDWSDDPRIVYSPLEVLFMMKKGDSAVIVQMADTLIKQGMQRQFPFAKKGDRINTYITVLDIFRVDSIFKKDYNAEMIKDKPRQEQEMKEAQAKQDEDMHKQLVEMQKQTAKEIEENKKSGEAEKEDKEMQAYLASKKITNAKKAGGTYVVVKEKGNGEPASPGKFITVKYSGKGLISDQVFDAGEYVFKAGDDFVIQGWHEGIPEFNKGGKGTLYIPGYLSYGKKAGPGGTPFEALIFDVEILNVSDTREKANADKKVADSIAAANPVKKTN